MDSRLGTVTASRGMIQCKESYMNIEQSNDGTSKSGVVLITGCSTGFGHGSARDLAGRGYSVYATMRNTDGKNSDRADSLMQFASSEDLDLHVLDLDVTSEHSVNRAVLPHMRLRRSGLLVHVSSVIGRVAIPFAGTYCASKYALVALSESMRFELSGAGIDVVVIEPGPFSTNIVANSPGPSDKARLAELPKEQEAFTIFMHGTERIKERENAPTDPAIVVKQIGDLIDMPAGTRPIRTPVGADFGVTELNQSIESIRIGVLDAMGFSQMEAVQL